MKITKRNMILTWVLLVICMLAIPVKANAKKYYSMEELGVSKFSGTPYYEIGSWKGNTITYRKYDTSKGSDRPKIGSWKKAKITKKTKYYVGNANRFYNVLDDYTDDEGYYYPSEVEFVKKTTKAQFKKYYRKSSFVWVDLVIKKGKVKTVIYKSQVAG